MLNKLISAVTLLMSCLLFQQDAHAKDLYIKITNSSDLNRVEELVEIPYSLIKPWVTSFDSPFVVRNAAGSELPYQLEYKGNAEPANVLVQVTCRAKSSTIITLKKGKPAVVAARTFARFVPERYDDFAWENDRVAFRMYGPALESKKDNAFGIDVWSKRTSALVVDKWYKGDNYHEDHGEGLDYYGVGKSLGAGDIAPYIKDSICYTNNYKTWKILDNGPLRTTFQLSYPAKGIDGYRYTLTKTITIDAGSQLNRIQADFNIVGKSSLPVVIGIVTRKGDDARMLSADKGVIAYWEPDNKEHGTTGVGCVFDSGFGGAKAMNGHLLAFGNVVPGKPLTYYAGAAWDRAGLIHNQQEWFNYLSGFRSRIAKPLSIILL
ncbi:DUF4861 family protein [Mucilaginibacter sp. PAMB04168]|uniref:DUF4861 family protein n=1 Tax=Mucilaginibacter sp. PAMB04168 TaxID=3138567 RepID=UPI0031F5FE64